MAETWSVHDAKQQFSQVLRAAAEKPQTITRHGADVAVLVDIAEYRRLSRSTDDDLKAVLIGGPRIENLDELIGRHRQPPYVPFEFDDGELWKD